MFRQIFKTITSLIFSPAKAWKELSAGKDDREEPFLTNYLYPLFGMITVAAFLGILLNRQQFDLQIALKKSILALASSFGGFYVAAWMLNEILEKFFHKAKNVRLCRFFVGYASAMMFALNILLSLLPEFFIMNICVLYTFYIVFQGAIPYMEVEVSQQVKFSIAATILIILLPYAIDIFLGIMMPGLRF